MTGGLLDTSVLIARNGERPLPETAAISVVTLGELRAGVLLARNEEIAQERAARLKAVRAAFAPLPVDEPVAHRFGEVLAVARSERRAVRATDLLIIATAATSGRRLYTRDVTQARLADAAGIDAVLV